MQIGYWQMKTWTIQVVECEMNMKFLVLTRAYFDAQVVQGYLPASIQPLLSGMHLRPQSD